MSNETYTITVVCSNCDDSYRIFIDKGISVQNKLHHEECRTCGRSDLYKAPNNQQQIHSTRDLFSADDLSVVLPNFTVSND